MSDQQLWLFSQPRALRERLGDDFFRKVPRCPGVYIITGPNERVLYVGQSSNLRQRLNSYKNIRPEKHPRKLVRLAQAAEKITWEECPHATAARLRENELLRLFRPKFNTVNTRPEAYGFVGLRVTELELELCLSDQVTAALKFYGAFKGLRRPAFAALIRLLLRLIGPTLTESDFPPGLLGSKPPKRFRFPLDRLPTRLTPGHLVELIQQYLDGQSPELVAVLRAALAPPEMLPLFWAKLQELDLEMMHEFFLRGPSRNRRLLEQHCLPDPIILPSALDDLLTLR